MMTRRRTTSTMLLGALALALGLWLVSSATPVSAQDPPDAVYEVNTPQDLPHDPPTVDCTNAAADCSLRAAVHAAANGPFGPTSVVEINVAGAGGDTLGLTTGNGPLDTSGFNGHLRVVGDGQTIDAGALKDRAWDARTVNSLTLDSVNVTGGFTQPGEHGAAIFVNGGSLTLINSVISDNKAQGDGGAIFADKAVVNVTEGSRLENNESDGSGAAIYVLNGGITVTDSHLTGNAADERGGAIASNAVFDITVTNSNLSGNSAGEGGAVWSTGQGGDLTITGSTLAANTSTFDGGAIVTVDHGGDLVISDTVIGGEMDEDGNTSEFGFGGALSTAGHSGALTITGSTVRNNASEISHGGALHLDSDTLTVSGSTFEGNTAGDPDDSASGGSGGAIHATGTDITITDDSVLRANVANQGSGDGGAIRSVGGSLTILGTDLLDNVAAGHGGAVQHLNGPLTIGEGSTLAGNTAGGMGGGVFGPADRIAIDQSTFSGNSAGGTGGALHVPGAVIDLDVTRSTFDGNSSGSRGGALFVAVTEIEGTVDVFASTLSGNTAASSGGAITIGGGGFLEVNLTAVTLAENSTFEAAHHLEAGEPVTVTRSIIVGEDQPACGGQIVSGGHNIATDDSCGLDAAGDQEDVAFAALELAALADNGGLTFTRALGEGSVAIEAAGACDELDQRGVQRPQGEACDVGAYEFQLEEPDPDPQLGDPGVTRVTAVTELCEFMVDSEDPAERIGLARDDDPADALAGSALPRLECILFTTGGPNAPLDAGTRAEIDRALAPGGEIVIFGGDQAVSQQAESELTAAGYNVSRLFGETRFETAEAIAARIRIEVPGPWPEAIVATGWDWPDAIMVGAYAAVGSTPVLLTPAPADMHPSFDWDLHPAAMRAIDALNPQRTFGIGGPAAVSDAALAATPDPTRIDGVNRMDTAVAIAEQLWTTVPEFDGDRFIMANIERADGYMLALGAVPLSRQWAAPALGLRATSYPNETLQYMTGQGFAELPAVAILGDVGYVNEDTADAIRDSIQPDADDGTDGG